MIIPMRVFASRVPSVLIAIAIIVTASGACTSPTSPTFGAPFTQTDLTVGTGTAAAAGQTLLVNYTGWLYDNTKSDKKGAQFDASPVGQPFIFKLGSGQVIKGWDQGLIGMKVGGIRRLVVPPELAYGRTGAGKAIPPNATLVFDIELLSVAGTPTPTGTGNGG
jgi:FKBP-type peptidyl-prolyl cis-trans isomerase FkpA